MIAMTLDIRERFSPLYFLIKLHKRSVYLLSRVFFFDECDSIDSVFFSFFLVEKSCYIRTAITFHSLR